MPTYTFKLNGKAVTTTAPAVSNDRPHFRSAHPRGRRQPISGPVHRIGLPHLRQQKVTTAPRQVATTIRRSSSHRPQLPQHRPGHPFQLDQFGVGAMP